MRRLICLCLCFAITLPLFFLAGCSSDLKIDQAYRFGYEDGYAAGYQDGLNDSGNTHVTPTCDYVLNKNTMKFHYPSCYSVGDIAEKNKIYFNGTRDEVVAKGYSSCKRCNP